MRNGQRVAFLTFSSTLHDARVQRMIRTLASNGYELHLVSPDIPAREDARIRHHSLPQTGASRMQLVSRLMRMAPAGLMAATALPLHRRQAVYREAYERLITIKPDIIHANDWITLTAATDAAQATGAKVIYDSHEFATEEHADRLWWRMLARPHVKAIESQLISRADHVLTVGTGLADAMQALYPGKIRDLTVIHNFPGKAKLPEPRQPDGQIRLIYAGLLRPERRISDMVEVLAQLDQRFSLELIGFGPAHYIAEVKKLAASRGVDNRMVWHPAVAPGEITTKIARADVGLFWVAGTSQQQSLALPNKIFDYTNAGLAIVSSGSTDVEKLISIHGNGICLHDHSVTAFCNAMNRLTPDMLARMQAQSRKASGQLNWEQEESRFLSVYSKF